MLPDRQLGNIDGAGAGALQQVFLKSDGGPEGRHAFLWFAAPDTMASDVLLHSILDPDAPRFSLDGVAARGSSLAWDAGGRASLTVIEPIDCGGRVRPACRACPMPSRALSVRLAPDGRSFRSEARPVLDGALAVAAAFGNPCARPIAWPTRTSASLLRWVEVAGEAAMVAQRADSDSQGWYVVLRAPGKERWAHVRVQQDAQGYYFTIE
jgi:hypothetical protein